MSRRSVKESRDLVNKLISDKETEVKNNIQKQKYDEGFVDGMKRAFDILKGGDD